MLLATTALLLPTATSAAEPISPAARKTSTMLQQLNGALSQLAERVSPAVVQIQVSGYGLSSDDDDRDRAGYFVRQRAVGSGVIVDPAGYILTNAHVVRGAQRIVVLLPAAGQGLRQESPRRHLYPARLVGVHRDSDLAVLKIDASGLPFLPLRSGTVVRQGELVVAVGSPVGLASTVTMGVVSSAARQLDPDDPMVFIQTDAPVNPGNSGGPLVNTDGEVVGINTFILSGSGGSEGLGFAIPAPVARFVYQGLRKRGFVSRVEVGISAQGINPELVAGLGLPRDWGVIVSDVAPAGPADRGGMRVGDLIESVNGRPIATVPDLIASLYQANDALLEIRVLRGGRPKELSVRAVQVEHPLDEMVDMVDPDKNLVRRLGVLGLDVDDKVQSLKPLRRPNGVIVVARTLDGSSVDSGLLEGDAIHGVNRVEVESVEQLRKAIDACKPGEPVVLQIEREGHFRYLFFDMD